jgi:pre-rRNA-processing protein TSR2
MTLLILEKWQLFQNSIKMILSKWAAFQTVLEESNWPQKEIELFELILEFFQTQTVAEYELEDNLKEFIEYTFETEFEDGSIKLVSRDICRLFDSIMKEEMHLYEELVKFAATGKSKIKLENSLSDDETNEIDNDAMKLDEPSSDTKKPEKVIDDDGFELVQRRRR